MAERSLNSPVHAASSPAWSAARATSPVVARDGTTVEMPIVVMHSSQGDGDGAARVSGGTRLARNASMFSRPSGLSTNGRMVALSLWSHAELGVHVSQVADPLHDAITLSTGAKPPVISVVHSVGAGQGDARDPVLEIPPVVVMQHLGHGARSLLRDHEW